MSFKRIGFPRLKANESIYIHVGQKHRLANETEEPLTVIEVQIGDYLGEDDIVRYEDVYRRDLNSTTYLLSSRKVVEPQIVQSKSTIGPC